MKPRKIILLFILPAAAIALAFLGSRFAGKSSGGAALTTVKIEREIVDMGKLTLNKPADAVFKLQNTGQHNLLIESVTPDCHCTGVVWDNQPIAPGAYTLVKTTYDSSVPGMFQKLIQVNANVEGSPLVLIIRGDVAEEGK